MTTDPYPLPGNRPFTPDRPAGYVQTTTAWQSIPKFIRFVIWLYAVASVVGVALWVVAMLVFVVGAAA